MTTLSTVCYAVKKTTDFLYGIDFLKFSGLYQSQMEEKVAVPEAHLERRKGSDSLHEGG
jgi:hypothetical protein